MATMAVTGNGISRREFLNYIWGASIALLTAQSMGLLTWLMLPRFREGEFGGSFSIPVGSVPAVNSEPVGYADGRFWLVNLSTEAEQANERMYQMDDEAPVAGVAAIYKVCTHLGCIYQWSTANERFECPCHGSKYRLDGRRISGPAPRSLDRFAVTALDAAGNELARSQQDAEGDWLPLVLPAETAVVRVETGDRELGDKAAKLCDAHGVC